MADLHKDTGLVKPKTSKIQIHTGRKRQEEAFKSKTKKVQKMHNSHSTHKLELRKAKGLTTVQTVKRAPKIATKKQIFSKATRRDRINLVRVCFGFGSWD
jgi:hypothetical protein